MKNIKCKMISRTMREITIDGKSAIVFLDFGSRGTSRFYGVEVENKVIQHGFSRLNEAKEYAINYLSKATK